jgi:uncharacterized membrane protein YhiD involved in acid resistance
MQIESTHFPATPIALKMGVAIGIGMLVGMEREWSNKDVGVRSFAIVALLGMLASVISTSVESAVFRISGYTRHLFKRGETCIRCTYRYSPN